MSRIAYVNGRYLPHAQAHVHIEDRGYQFSDGIYEYIAFYNQKLLDGGLHLVRLERSLKELSITMPMSMAAFYCVIRELIQRNGRVHGGLYMQISRGVAKRDHPFPKNVKPSLVMTVCAPKTPKPQEIKDGVKVITQPDLRWARRDIKSVSLLANVLAKQAATQAKAREAWLLEGKMVTEGAVSNAYIITKSGEVITHPADEHILGGVTRDVVLRLARKAGVAVVERPIPLAEIKQSAEAFITSTSANVLPVVKVDDVTIGNGKVGDITKKLLALYHAHIFKETGYQF